MLDCNLQNASQLSCRDNIMQTGDCITGQVVAQETLWPRVYLSSGQTGQLKGVCLVDWEAEDLRFRMSLKSRDPGSGLQGHPLQFRGLNIIQSVSRIRRLRVSPSEGMSLKQF